MIKIKTDAVAPIRTVTEGNAEPVECVTVGNTERSECTAQITASIKILPVKPLLLYQKLAPKATQLRLLGLSIKEIAKRLEVSKGTVENALKWKRR